MKYPPVQYHDYLQMDKILGSQTLRSEELGKKAHDEMLFIIVHQTYELWFKQMLFELDSVLEFFSQKTVDESLMGTAVSRLERIVEIQKFINGQIDVLETMTPLDFLEFRDFLYPASGFQSFQWRCLETKLGLKMDQRLSYNQQPFYKHLKPEQQKQITEVLQQPSLFDLIEKWLERTPFVQAEDFVFWKDYQRAVENLLESDKQVVNNNTRLSPEEKKRNLDQIDASLATFHALFSEEKYLGLQEQGYFRMSAKALHAALLIQLYREQPVLQMPFRMISALIDLDENMTQWRYRHSLMVHRMLGRKIGTGGSSGHEYLKAATDQHKIFTDFFNLTTFFIPRSQIPALPNQLKQRMGYHYLMDPKT
ncbi:MAG: tryptophan 2,3-dioxygenase [Bdellovibrio sp. CG10_big_fil_rev_8_21_14_0_10_47_8]|nr:MAG: tryptophan 2,3-dioxygenase [Bdellovibrio sp. CG10_big_fil_rev_8_21_14_0_10_47_8]